MNSINKTMYIPLFGKSYVSKKGIILQDKMAVYQQQLELDIIFQKSFV